MKLTEDVMNKYIASTGIEPNREARCVNAHIDGATPALYGSIYWILITDDVVWYPKRKKTNDKR